VNLAHDRPDMLALTIVNSFCRIPAGHTAAPTLAVAEKMGDVIKAEYAKA